MCVYFRCISISTINILLASMSDEPLWIIQSVLQTKEIKTLYENTRIMEGERSEILETFSNSFSAKQIQLLSKSM